LASRNYLTLTTERVWFARGRFIWKKQRNLPLAKVQDATYKKNLGYGLVLVTNRRRSRRNGQQSGVATRTLATS